MLCQVVLLFHFFSSCFSFYFGGSKLEHSALEGSRRMVSMEWRRGRRAGGVGKGGRALMERQLGELPHQYQHLQARHTGWGPSKEWGKVGGALRLCIVASSRRESAKSWLAPNGRWDGWDTPHPAPAVPRTFRCCRRAVAALLFFCKWEEQEKSRLLGAHSPFRSPSPYNPTVW